MSNRCYVKIKNLLGGYGVYKCASDICYGYLFKIKNCNDILSRSRMPINLTKY